MMKNASIGSGVIEEMHAIQMPISMPQNEEQAIHQTGYGFGWMIGSYRGVDCVSHGGSIDGFFSEVALLYRKRNWKINPNVPYSFLRNASGVVSELSISFEGFRLHPPVVSEGSNHAIEEFL